MWRGGEARESCQSLMWGKAFAARKLSDTKETLRQTDVLPISDHESGAEWLPLVSPVNVPFGAISATYKDLRRTWPVNLLGTWEDGRDYHGSGVPGRRKTSRNAEDKEKSGVRAVLETQAKGNPR